MIDRFEQPWSRRDVQLIPTIYDSSRKLLDIPSWLRVISRGGLLAFTRTKARSHEAEKGKDHAATFL